MANTPQAAFRDGGIWIEGASASDLLYLDADGTVQRLAAPPSDGRTYVLTCYNGTLAWGLGGSGAPAGFGFNFGNQFGG